MPSAASQQAGRCMGACLQDPLKSDAADPLRVGQRHAMAYAALC